MKLDDAIEEGLGDDGRGVGVTQGEEVGVFGELIDHRYYDALAMYPQEAIDEVHSNVGPNLCGHLKGLQEASGVEVLRLVPLACQA